ncbi:MAG: hypothetical protein IJH73_10145 [Lachnospiraceae bacterium]|nr:hypothetical protein [Lachnospiraceae bacterium]MBQ1516011.1 hypothetical protein [Lachnospiraceae bacterium]MBQ4309032.1 hypothetical protein [Lachnospiraceae bacterium]MBR0402850.1 hypothetical protein [Lachnospiraceae bacterium]
MNTIIIRAVFFMKNDAGEDCAVLVRNITPDGDWYSAPGGEMRSGEALTERLVELIREQCGVIITPKEILFDEKTGEFMDMYFLCEHVSGEFAPIHEEEILRTKTNRVPGTSTPELVPLAQVKHLYLLPPKLKEYLRKMDR